MNKIIEKIKEENVTFEDIKNIDSNSNEYLYARELQKILEYVEWRKFEGVIEKAKNACNNSNYNVLSKSPKHQKCLMVELKNY